MNKKVASLICSLALMFSGLAYLVFQSPVAQAANVVQNPGFETAGTGGAADAANWTEGTLHARASDKFNTGAWSLKSTYRSTGTDTRQTVPVATNTSYTFSVYIWKTTSTGGSCADMNDIVGEVQLCVTTQTGSWQFKSGTWNSGTNTSVTLRLITDNSPTGDIWFDDVSLDNGSGPTNTPTNTPTRTNTPTGPTNTPTKTNTPVPSGNVVQNPSFETAGASSADAASWTEGTNHARASDKFNTGAWSLKSSFIGAGGTSTSQTVTVATGTNYTYSGYIWRAATVGGSCMDMNDLIGEVQLCTTTTGSWQFKSGAWTSGSTTSVTLRLITDGNPNNNIWFDDISLASAGTPVPTNTPTKTPTPCGGCPTPSSVVVAGAGDIACGAGSGGASCKQGATSDLLVAMNPDKVITLGDVQYEEGALSDFNSFYDPAWGRVKSKTSPSVGNHEYLTAGASGYYSYFGAAAGDPAKGYYSYNVGAWHMVAINTNCSQVGGCAVGNPQYTWLQSDLNAHPECTIVYAHHPQWSSDTRNFDTDPTPYKAMVQLMYDKGVELYLVGHSHFYERFARQSINQVADPTYGLREIVIGTGGRNVYGFGTIRPNSEVRDGASFGVIKMTLSSNSYTWDFIPAAGYSFTDHGSESCHGAHP